ncbi:AI-2E family transporter [Paenibacillus sacheonensis]|uniref:AI-2E family transporter n=1 Tax=Paenibacillus sacheonensis TaxID=742054 RepID=A0A7X4YSB4_9BACL|nr:AI-2E family transporter [Paenibacillus sacheonensis]MBM7566662.1 putative PurR-regulated permease PerM [Paenibacillus sacheonensis]NBC70644.1 AI-2E family transporter [Paenibacillus sacheonensis]
MSLQKGFFRVCLGIIALLLIVYLTAKISFIFRPLLTIFNILIVPFMLAGFCYYLLRPIVNVMVERRVNKVFAILLIYLFVAAIISLFGIVVWPQLKTQVENFVKGAPELIEGFKNQLNRLQDNRMLSAFAGEDADLSTKLSDYLNKGITAASDYVANVVAIVTNFLIIIATVPIILYYMLKESDHIPSSILAVVPRRYRKDGQEVLKEIDSALSGFIVGRVIITCLLAVMLYIGFLIIGLPYSLLLAIVAFFLNIIPYIGQFLGAIPTIIVAFTVSPTMVFWVVVVTIIAQQIEGNVLSPSIYGRRLDIHPLTTIILLLVAGEVAGFIGIILAIPGYMVIKIIIVRIYQLFLAEKVEELVD